MKATACDGAAIGGGSAGWGSYYGGSAKGIVICDHATVAARSDTGHGAAIGAAAGDNGKDTEAEVTIGTAGGYRRAGRCPCHGNRVLRLCHWQWRKRYQGHHSGPFDHLDGEHKKFHCDRK